MSPPETKRRDPITGARHLLGETSTFQKMEPFAKDYELKRILDWCASVVGPCEVVSGDARFHGRTAVCRLATLTGHCYLKIHQLKSFWEREVHAYEQWGPAFGAFAPNLLAVHENEPLALLVGELAGEPLEKRRLSARQTEAVWRDAGRALAGLHAYAVGERFGPCGRDGACTGNSVGDAKDYILTELEHEADRGLRAGYLNDDQLVIIRAAQYLAPAFAGERPIPCHRDYGPANWLVTEEGIWAGVIDFEFAYWDVRVADFSRYPNWEWMERPDLLKAFFDGYGRPLTPKEEQQRLVMHVYYALGAIIWGHDHSYLGFAEEGRKALVQLAPLLQ